MKGRLIQILLPMHVLYKALISQDLAVCKACGKPVANRSGRPIDAEVGVDIWLWFNYFFPLYIVNGGYEPTYHWKRNTSGWWYTYLKNMSSSVGMIIPNLWKNKKMFQTTNQTFQRIVSLGGSFMDWTQRRRVTRAQVPQLAVLSFPARSVSSIGTWRPVSAVWAGSLRDNREPWVCYHSKW